MTRVKQKSKPTREMLSVSQGSTGTINIRASDELVPIFSLSE